MLLVFVFPSRNAMSKEKVEKSSSLPRGLREDGKREGENEGGERKKAACPGEKKRENGQREKREKEAPLSRKSKTISAKTSSALFFSFVVSPSDKIGSCFSFLHLFVSERSRRKKLALLFFSFSNRWVIIC